MTQAAAITLWPIAIRGRRRRHAQRSQHGFSKGSRSMPKTSEMRESKFLKQSDIGRGALMTVSDVKSHNVAKEGADPELKWCLEFEEAEKPLVLNSVNIQLCEKI